MRVRSREGWPANEGVWGATWECAALRTLTSALASARRSPLKAVPAVSARSSSKAVRWASCR